MKKINEFATHNDTDMWAVCVDGFFGLFADKAEAQKVYESVGGDEGDDGLAETCFGSACLLPPHYVCKFYDGTEPKGGFDRISAHRPIDIAGYIKKHAERAQLNFEMQSLKPQPAVKRLANTHMWDFLFGEATK
jgi:hypothetical protein